MQLFTIIPSYYENKCILLEIKIDHFILKYYMDLKVFKVFACNRV